MIDRSQADDEEVALNRFKNQICLALNRGWGDVSVTKLAEELGTSRANITKVKDGCPEGISSDLLVRWASRCRINLSALATSNNDGKARTQLNQLCHVLAALEAQVTHSEDDSPSYQSVSDYLVDMSAKFSSEKIKWLIAICASKPWPAELVRDYYTKNAEVVQQSRDANPDDDSRWKEVSRIFVVEDSQSESDLARMHRRLGLNTKIVNQSNAKKLHDEIGIPPTMGLTVFSDATVVMHTGKERVRVTTIKDELIAKKVIALYQRIEKDLVCRNENFRLTRL